MEPGFDKVFVWIILSSEALLLPVANSGVVLTESCDNTNEVLCDE